MRRDEVLSLVGGSGSGKTQLVRVILGLKRPKAGTVRVFGVSWDAGWNENGKAKAEAQLAVAATTIAEGKAKMELKLYNEAFILFQKAHRLAQEAKLLLEAQIRLPIDLKVDIRANGDAHRAAPRRAARLSHR